MKLLKNFVILCTFLLINSCSDNPTEFDRKDSIIPLEVGNKWRSSRAIYDTSGTVIYSDTAMMEIKKDTLLSNEHLYEIFAGFSYYTLKDDGLWEYITWNGTIDKYLFYKYPCRPGQSYFVPGRPGNTVIITSINKKVNVPAGSFTCVVYYSKNERMKMHSFTYICPGIGIIKSETIGIKSNGAEYKYNESVLTDFYLKL